MRGPRTQSSPEAPIGTTSPVDGSITFASTCGITTPTVSTRCSKLSPGIIWNEIGDVSVMPYSSATSRMCIRSIAARTTSAGHGAPPISPPRSVGSRAGSKSGWSSIAMNIVGTP